MDIIQENIHNELLTLSGGDDNLIEIVTDIVERSAAYVLDGEEDFNQLEGCEKSIFGIKFEKRFVDAFDLPRKRKKHSSVLDTRISGYDVDIKTTLGGKTWTIPKEALNQWSLVLKVNYIDRVFRLGSIFLSEDRLTFGKNQDRKVTISAAGREHIDWIMPQVPFNQNAYKMTIEMA